MLTTTTTKAIAKIMRAAMTTRGLCDLTDELTGLAIGQDVAISEGELKTPLGRGQLGRILTALILDLENEADEAIKAEGKKENESLPTITGKPCENFKRTDTGYKI
jgi:flagellar biosynthesis/type III secretory pathway ATPase